MAVVHMNVGDGDLSYTNNSSHQKIGISRSMHVLDEAIKDMINDNGFPRCFKIADLGCSSGPNTLSVISYIIGKIEELSQQKNSSSNPPEYEVFLSDLPGNDFNTLFKLLPDFYDKLDKNNNNNNNDNNNNNNNNNDNNNNNKSMKKWFVSGLPGSFYGRLFPCSSLNLVYSSYSLQWLSQVPRGLESNKENIHMSMTSPPEIYEAYAKQHRKDFYTFLNSRGQEMVPGGRMVLTFVGRSVVDPSSKDDCEHFALLASTLLDMVSEGKIKEEELHSFNMPIYTPSKEEVEEIVHFEGSFNLEKIEGFLVPWDAHVDCGSANLDKYKRGELVSNFIRAYSEPVLATHFGSSVMDELYERYGKKLGEHLSMEEPFFFNIAICLSKI